MRRIVLALATWLLTAATAAAAAGIPLGQPFDVPINADGQAIIGKAVIVEASGDSKPMFVFYIAGDKLGQISYLITRGAAPDPTPGPGPDPQPGPQPDPGPGPDPDPDPQPQPGPLHVLVVYESDDLDTMPPEQAAILTSQPVRQYLAEHCATGPGGQPAFRFLDDDADVTRLADDWQQVFARARGKPLPWIVIANETATFEGELPANADALLELLRRYGGQN